MTFRFGFLFCGLIAVTLANYCPNGAYDYGDLGECILGVEAAAPFDLAQSTCQILGGQVAQIYTESANLFGVLSTMNVVSGADTRAYIGVIAKDGQRINADGTPLNFQRFATADEYTSDSPCTVLDMNDFNWYAADCQTARPFLCTFSDLGGAQCPPGWSQNDQTGKCYYIQNVPTIGVINKYTQAEAEVQCQKMGGHLASIHSDAEDIFLRNLMATSNKDVLCTDWEALIGASCSETEGKSWTDGSVWNYDLTEGTCNGTYAVINDDHCPGYMQRIWNNWDGGFKFARFVCKREPNTINNH